MTFGIILTAVGWVLALAFTALTVSGVARMARTRGGWKDPGRWDGPLIFFSAAAVMLTLAGVLTPLRGALVAALPLFLLAGGLVKPFRVLAARDGWAAATRRILSGLGRRLRAELRYAFRDIRALLAGMRGEGEPGSAATAPLPAPTASPRMVQVPRGVPSVREDPALGPVPAAAEVAQGLAGGGVMVTPQWAALCESVATHEPDTDDDEIAFTAAHAAGVLSYADAWRAKAENLLHGTGLDPAYVAGHHEFADEFADLAAALTLVNQRFHVIYGALRDWVDEHPEGMPHKAREWLQGGGEGQQDTGPADEAA